MKLSLRAKLALSNLANPVWWKDAAKRALYSAVAIALPYLAATQLVAEVSWLTVVSAGAVGAVASLATSLAGLPEVDGVDLPWWLAAVERVVKTFAQALAAGLLGAVLLTDVDWGVVLQASAMAALVSLVRLILATLPADPTRVVPAQVIVVNESPLLDPASSTHAEYQGAIEEDPR
ncbi:MAG TPA: holin [Microbacterium sp.]|uniref:holin n=1 Tax=Microbacterium sp. TaxID=51671 RepID=UPI002F93DA44